MQIGAIFISMSVLPGTPIWAILVFAFTAASYVAYKGARHNWPAGDVHRALCHAHRCSLFPDGAQYDGLENHAAGTC